MLHLESRVHLEEIELCAAFDEELDRARAAISGGARGRDRGLTHPRAELGRDRPGRTLFNDLLVAPLDRAFTLEEVHDVAVGVGEHLNLHVARTLDQTLDVERAVAERRVGFPPRGGREIASVGVAPHDAHALAAAAR